MLYPTLSDLAAKVGNRYLLVNLTAKRAREIADIAEANEVKLTEKPVTLALDDVINDRIIPVCEEPQE